MYFFNLFHIAAAWYVLCMLIYVLHIPSDNRISAAGNVARQPNITDDITWQQV